MMNSYCNQWKHNLLLWSDCIVLFPGGQLKNATILWNSTIQMTILNVLKCFQKRVPYAADYSSQRSMDCAIGFKRYFWGGFKKCQYIDKHKQITLHGSFKFSAPINFVSEKETPTNAHAIRSATSSHLSAVLFNLKSRDICSGKIWSKFWRWHVSFFFFTRHDIS